MIKRNPIPTNFNPQNYNNHNLHEYTPYIIKDEQVIIDETWYNSLSKYIQQLISTRLKDKFTLGQVTVPHEYQVDNQLKQLTTIYHAYIDGFDYHVWYSPYIPNGPQSVKLIHIPDTTKKVLLQMHDTRKYIPNVHLSKLERKIQKHMMPNTSYFVRLSSTSGKNEKSVEPFDSPYKIIMHLSSVKLFVDQEFKRDKDTYLILVPWQNKIDTRNEFRIFIHNKKLVAASPQKYWELNQHSQEELEAIEYALTYIKFIDQVSYDTFVADVYIDIETRICQLIELNPFGAHSGAGASLFNWETDYDLLHGKNHDQIELRYVSAINY